VEQAIDLFGSSECRQGRQMFECGSRKNLADLVNASLGSERLPREVAMEIARAAVDSLVALWLGKQFDRSAQLSGGVSRPSSVTASA
jgi:hypothetical protein